MSESGKAPSGDTWAHRPLPYVVRLRISADDDKPSVQFECRGVAYSLMEAMVQATVAATGQAAIDNQKIAVEQLEPDLDAYLVMLCEEVESETLAREAVGRG